MEWTRNAVRTRFCRVTTSKGYGLRSLFRFPGAQGSLNGGCSIWNVCNRSLADWSVFVHKAEREPGAGAAETSTRAFDRLRPCIHRRADYRAANRRAGTPAPAIPFDKRRTHCCSGGARRQCRIGYLTSSEPPLDRRILPSTGWKAGYRRSGPLRLTWVRGGNRLV
jgi:hypothetical protein